MSTPAGPILETGRRVSGGRGDFLAADPSLGFTDISDIRARKKPGGHEPPGDA